MQLILFWRLKSYEEDSTQGEYELIVDKVFIGYETELVYFRGLKIC